MSLLHSRSLLLLPFAVLLAACATKDASTSKGAAAPDSAKPVAAAVPHQMTILATDYNFDAPDQVPAGMMTVHLVDNGSELHHVSFIALKDGKSMADLEQAIKAMKPNDPSPSWMVDHGGVNAPHPGGGMASATQMLEAGSYALICFIPSPDGVPHFAKGMVRALTVAASTGAALPEPVADIVMSLKDYSFTLSKAISAGKHTIRIESSGAQSHEVQLLRLAPGMKAGDVPAWLAKPNGPPPGETIGGVPAMAMGSAAYITADFTPGEYALICFLPDVKDGKPHFAHGMIQQLHVS
jgi:hypothetical protein